MPIAHLTLLLQLVHSNAGVDPLSKQGLTYLQIAKLTKKAIEDGLIEIIDSGWSLTDLGLEKMRLSESSGKPRKDGGWISPEIQSRIEKYSLFDIYLPHKNVKY